MKCSFCGADLKEHTLYCESCGKEVRMVPDYNMYDEDYLNKVLLNQDEASEDEETVASEEIERAKREERLKKIRQQKELERKKKIKQRNIILISGGIVLAILVVAIIIAVVKISNDNSHSKSYAYQLEQGKIAQKDNRIDDAIEYYNKAALLDKTDTVVRFLLVELYLDKKDYNNAIVVCSEILSLDKSDIKAYEYILKAYDGKADYDSIKSLSANVPSDDAILALFDDYLVVSPVPNLEAGTYEDYITIEFSAGKNSTIFYTIDGEDPKGDRAVEYSEPIELKEAKKYRIKAIAKNDKGVYSDPVNLLYEIDLAAPVTPYYIESANGLDEKNEPIVGAFFMSKNKPSELPGTLDPTTPEEPNGETEKKKPIIIINVPENCVAYYKWNDPTPSVTSEKYDAAEGIEMMEGNNAFYVIFIDERNEKCSSIGSKLFEYYSE